MFKSYFDNFLPGYELWFCCERPTSCIIARQHLILLYKRAVFLWISTLYCIYFTYIMDINRITWPTARQLSLRTVSICFFIYLLCTFVNIELLGLLIIIRHIRHGSPIGHVHGRWAGVTSLLPIHPVDWRFVYFDSRYVRHTSGMSGTCHACSSGVSCLQVTHQTFQHCRLWKKYKCLWYYRQALSGSIF